MEMKGIGTTVIALLALPGAAMAQGDSDSLTIYGKVHLSADGYDNDAGAAGGIEEDDGFSLSSNSTRIGFKGTHGLQSPLDLVWQLEQEVTVDSRNGDDVFTTRNSYLGVKGGFGTFLAGYYDTPFKDLGSDFTLFADTVADRRAILGAFVGQGNTMNDRAANALVYKGEFGPVGLNLIYGADQDGSPGTADDNDNALTGASLLFEAAGFSAGVAYEEQEDIFGGNEATGIRAGIGYAFGPVKVQGIYETITSDDSDVAERDAYGGNITFAFGAGNEIGAQMLVADDYENSSNTGATMASIGISRELDKQTDIYLVYTNTDNDDGADYQGVDGGHGDEVKTDLGGNPSAISIGAVLAF